LLEKIELTDEQQRLLDEYRKELNNNWMNLIDDTSFKQ
jgi:hypothetical protein